MKAILRIVFAVAFWIAPNVALSGNMSDFSGSYFCTADAAGGVSYNDGTKKWEGTIFRVEDRYILTVKLFGEVEQEYQTDKKTYFVTFSEHGNEAVGVLEGSCYTNNNKLREINPLISYITENGDLSCKLMGGDLDVNLVNGRFLKSYNWGYVDGVDNNSNTPHIEIGKCSRID